MKGFYLGVRANTDPEDRFKIDSTTCFDEYPKAEAAAGNTLEENDGIAQVAILAPIAVFSKVTVIKVDRQYRTNDNKEMTHSDLG